MMKLTPNHWLAISTTLILVGVGGQFAISFLDRPASVPVAAPAVVVKAAPASPVAAAPVYNSSGYSNGYEPDAPTQAQPESVPEEAEYATLQRTDPPDYQSLHQQAATSVMSMLQMFVPGLFLILISFHGFALIFAKANKALGSDGGISHSAAPAAAPVSVKDKSNR